MLQTDPSLHSTPQLNRSDEPEQEQDSECMPAGPAAGLKLVIVLAALGALMLGVGPLVDSLNPADPVFMENSLSEEVRMHSLLNRLLGLSLLSLVGAACFCVWAIKTSLRARRSGQWPPPGTLVLKATRIRRGRQATLSWIGMLAVAGMGLAIAVLSLVLWWSLSELVQNVRADYTQQVPLQEQLGTVPILADSRYPFRGAVSSIHSFLVRSQPSGPGRLSVTFSTRDPITYQILVNGHDLPPSHWRRGPLGNRVVEGWLIPHAYLKKGRNTLQVWLVGGGEMLIESVTLGPALDDSGPAVQVADAGRTPSPSL